MAADAAALGAELRGAGTTRAASETIGSYAAWPLGLCNAAAAGTKVRYVPAIVAATPIRPTQNAHLFIHPDAALEGARRSASAVASCLCLNSSRSSCNVDLKLETKLNDPA